MNSRMTLRAILPMLVFMVWGCATVNHSAPATEPPAQTPAQMVAGIDAVVRMLDAEMQMRFVHTPNQQFFKAAMRILSATQSGIVQKFPGRGVECPQGTIHENSLCVGMPFADRYPATYH